MSCVSSASSAAWGCKLCTAALPKDNTASTGSPASLLRVAEAPVASGSGTARLPSSDCSLYSPLSGGCLQDKGAGGEGCRGVQGGCSWGAKRCMGWREDAGGGRGDVGGWGVAGGCRRGCKGMQGVALVRLALPCKAALLHGYGTDQLAIRVSARCKVYPYCFIH